MSDSPVGSAAFHRVGCAPSPATRCAILSSSSSRPRTALRKFNFCNILVDDLLIAAVCQSPRLGRQVLRLQDQTSPWWPFSCPQ